MMTLEEAIKHCNEVACKHNECAMEHKQLAQWLTELKGYKNQKPVDKNEIEIPFVAKDSELQETTYYIPKGFYAEIDGDKVVIKNGEKPTAWSAAMWYLKKRNAQTQNHWKPSDEQMKAFEHFVRSVGESGYASPYDNNTKLLYSLLSDLKKLKYL